MDISEIKSQLSIQMVLQHYGLVIKNNHVHCPFHADKTPSMRVYNDTGSVFCFSGNCSQGNKVIDIIDFILLKENCNKHQAILKAKELLGYNTKQSTAEIFYLLQTQLKRSKKAQSYLQSRGLEKLTIVGSNHRNGGNQVPYILPHLKNCVVFPLKGSSGDIVSLYGRSFTSTIKGCHYYLTDRKGLYPNYPSPNSQQLILTESIIDAATLQQHAKLPPTTSVLACYGTNGFTQEHTEAVSQLKNLKTVAIFFDGDEAGQKAANKLANQLQAQFPNVSIKIVTTPEQEDINSLWQNHEDPELFITLLKEAESIKAITKIHIPELNIANQTTSKTIKKVIPITQKPTAKTLEIESKETAAHLVFTLKGTVKNTGDSLKVTLQTSHSQNNQLLIQKLDLYDYSNLEKHAKQASKALLLDTSIILQEWQTYGLQLEKQQVNYTKEKEFTLDEATKNRCLEFLQSPNLLERVNQAIGQTGVVGEVENRLLLLLIASSYHHKNPLHGLIQGSSGSGKTKLLQSIYKLLPTEICKSFTRVTESSFYNYGEYALSHKTLCFEDIDGLKEEALLALRELQSNGKLTSSTSQKLESGKITSGENTVNGPIASLSCTTKADLYEDNISRCFVVAVDESVRQTANIIDFQNQLHAGKIDTTNIKSTQKFIQNCIRILRPIPVVNPYASIVKLPQNVHKLRRLHGMYQNLVAQVTWWHQYQRKKDRHGRIIADKQDLQIACDILFETIILKVDELHGSLRQFYEALKTGIQKKGEETLFNRFEIKQLTGLGTTQTRKYVEQLVNLEYLQQFGYANRGFNYKIVQWDNHTALRIKIKEELQHQIDKL